MDDEQKDIFEQDLSPRMMRWILFGAAVLALLVGLVLPAAFQVLEK